MSGSFQHVAHNHEILQHILLHVDVRTLLVSASRVCRQWHEMIACSSQIQERLFRKPVSVRRGTRKKHPVQNPLIQQRGWFLHTLFRIREDDLDDLKRALENDMGYPVHVPSTPSSVVPLWHLVHEIEDSLYATSAFARRGASWRGLLLQQPAITQFGQVISRRHPRGWYDTEMGLTECSGGLRLGHLWDAMREAIGHLNTSSCYLRLVWWEPSVTPFDTEDWPMADEMVRLFDRGAQLVLLIGYTISDEDHIRGYGVERARKMSLQNVLNRCEEFAPLRFRMAKLPRFQVDQRNGQRILV